MLVDEQKELMRNLSEIVILAVCFQLKQLKKQPEKNSGLNELFFFQVAFSTA